MDRKQATPYPLEYWRIRVVAKVLGLGESTIKKMVRQKRFPPPVKLTPRTSTWRSDVVLQWGAERELLTRAGMVPNPSPWLKEAGKKATKIKKHAKLLHKQEGAHGELSEARHLQEQHTGPPHKQEGPP